MKCLKSNKISERIKNKLNKLLNYADCKRQLGMSWVREVVGLRLMIKCRLQRPLIDTLDNNLPAAMPNWTLYASISPKIIKLISVAVSRA